MQARQEYGAIRRSKAQLYGNSRWHIGNLQGQYRRERWWGPMRNRGEEKTGNGDGWSDAITYRRTGNVAVEIFRLDKSGCAPRCSNAPAYICTHFLCVSKWWCRNARWKS